MSDLWIETGVVTVLVAISFALPYVIGFLINCKMDKGE